MVHHLSPTGVAALLLLALVQGLQWAGDRLVIKLSRR